jgi:hypothetical protein
MGFSNKFSNRLWGCVVAVLLCAGLAVASTGDQGQITVIVIDSVGIAPAILRQGEAEAERVFRLAGIEIAWVQCVRGSTDEMSACRAVPGVNEFVLHIVPTGKTSSDSVFGEAFLAEDGSGKYSDVFFDRIEDAHRSLGASVGLMLGAVAAHELGHLLLGSNAHSQVGIMEPVWKKEALREIGMGLLLFTADQSSLMKSRMGRAAVTVSASGVWGRAGRIY